MIIYKITNIKNNKVYIGLTTRSLKDRWRQHLQAAKNSTHHLYRSMRKYGIENFTIEEIDNTDDFQKLAELERFYIKKYNSRNSKKGYNILAGGESNQLDDNPRAKLTLEEVIQIRMIYAYCELGCKECWNLFKHKISYSAFEKIYEGKTWKSVCPEVFSKENKNRHKHFNSAKGEKNHDALYTDEEVLMFRKYYVEHSLEEAYIKFGNKSKTKIAFRSCIDQSYLHLPVYKKKQRKWYLKENIIDINNYNPVSTISVSGE